MRLAIQPALWVVLSCVPLAAQRAKADPIDAYLSHAMQAAHIPAVAVAVIKNGKVVKLKAYGTADLEQQTPATADTAFQLASGTKLFTGILVMRLVQEGKLGLRDPISKYLTDAPAAWRDVTVAQLAAHVSGLPDVPNAPSSFADAAAVAAWAAAKPLVRAPGVQAVYNQAEFAVLAVILSKASGRSFEQLLDDEIVRPLGLTSTRYANLRQEASVAGSSMRIGDVVPRRAGLYAWEAGRQRTMEYLYPNWAYAAGGLFSSAADLAKVFQALQGETLLSTASKHAFDAPYRLNDGKDGPFGVAWIVRHRDGRLAVGHSGGPANSDLWLYPERGIAIAVLTNEMNLPPVLADGIADLVDPHSPAAR